MSAVPRAEAADALVEAAESLTPRPLSASLATLNDRLGANRGSQEWELELAAPLWLPRQQNAQKALGASTREEVRASQRALRLQLAGELREAWWAVAAARNGEQLAERRARTAASLEADVIRRSKAGELARVDANLASSERLDAQAALATAHSERLQAEEAFRALSAMDAPETLIPEGVAVLDAASPADHPQIAADLAAVQLARDRLAVADAAQREAPELALRVVRERGARGESYASALGLKLTIPFSLGPRARQESAAARAELAQAEGQVALQERKLLQETGKARRELATGQKQLQLARERLALSTDTLVLAEKSFSLGESDLPALLRARAAAQDAEVALAREEISLYAWQSRLNQSLGVLP
ncbi:MAG: TolC family protein [Burkholderiaceae bacterium]|nr:TolC family protein [Burkholderiaceae bacterium]